MKLFLSFLYFVIFAHKRGTNKRTVELRRVRKNTPQRGVLVYPLGFEPRLDGVGGRNVIQLHYEYLS